MNVYILIIGILHVGILNNHCTQIELLLNRVQYIFISTCWIPTLNQSIKTLHFGTHWTHWTDLKWVLVIRFSKILQKNFIIASSRLLVLFLMEDLPSPNTKQQLKTNIYHKSYLYKILYQVTLQEPKKPHCVDPS